MRDDVTNAHGQQLLSDWDATPAQRFFVHIVSCIFYARGSFPATCFRRVSDEQWEHSDTTHERLLSSGEPLSSSMSLKNFILSQSGSFIYPRRSEDCRLARFLDSLHGILAAIQQRRLGRYRICLSRSKSQNPDALIELYDLIFRYTEGGSLFVSVKWGGTRETKVSTASQNPFNEFLRTRGPITGTFYTHPFIYSNDGEPLDEKVDHGLGMFLRQAVPLLQGRRNSDGGRIGTLAYHSEADSYRNVRRASLMETNTGHQETGLAKQRGAFAQEIRQLMPFIHRGHRTENLKGQGSNRVASLKTRSIMYPPSKEQPKHEGSNCRKAPVNNTLSVYEEASDQLPSTQLVSSPHLHRQHLKRPRPSSPDRQCSNGLLLSSPWPPKRRHDGSSIRSSSVDNVPQLDASQLQPCSSAESTHGFVLASATSSKPQILAFTAQKTKPR